MKLYLSSMGIPAPEELAALLGKSFDKTNVALIPNAKDYYSKRAWDFTINSRIEYMKSFGFNIETVDLKDYTEGPTLKVNCQIITSFGQWVAIPSCFVMK